MKQSILLIYFFCFVLQAFPQKYVKVWSDEFNTPGLPDSTKWGYEIGKLRNDELQYYTYKRSENARIQDTVLILEARKEAYQGAAYTSASLISKLKGDWLYGKFEYSIKVPTGKGTWPAVWMMPTYDEYGAWPKSGEMDLMEYVGMNANNLYYTAHFEGTDGTGHQSSGFGSTFIQPYSKFVKFTFVWSPAKLEWYADDKLYFTYAKPANDVRVWPFDKMFYMILNMAYGGNWGAQQGIDDTKLPHQFLIDYIRVYQMQESTGPFSLTIEPATGGTVEVTPKMDSYPEGTHVTIKAVPDATYEFDKWLHVGSANPIQLTVSKETSLIPIFKKKNELILNGYFSLGILNWGSLYFSDSKTMAATASVVNGIYAINITKPGTAGWHICDQQSNITIEKGATYLVSFDAKADKPNVMDVFISKNHDDYGGYYSTTKNLTSVMQHFSWTFKMLQTTDINCRFGFGFGKFTGNVYLDNVSVSKQDLTGTAVLAESTNELFELFPNPACDYLDVTNKSTRTLHPSVDLYNLQGQLITNLLKDQSMSSNQQIRINLNNFNLGNGVYLVNISTPEKSVTRKLIINRP